MTHEPCHTNAGHKIFVMGILKESLGGIHPAKPSFGITATGEMYSIMFTDYISHLMSYHG